MLIDMHVHTNDGSCCSIVGLEAIVKILMRKGFNGVLLTDHQSDAGYKKYSCNCKSFRKFSIFRGFEILTTLGDMIVILPLSETVLDIEEVINKRIHPIELADIVHNKNGVIGIAHMFRDEFNCIGISTKSVNEIRRIMEKVDFIETVNGYACNESNAEADKWAEEYSLPKTGGSDTHCIDTIGLCGTLFPAKIGSEMDLIGAIKNKIMIKPLRKNDFRA